MAEGVGIEPTRPVARSQFSKLLPYHSAQPSSFGLILRHLKRPVKRGILEYMDDEASESQGPYFGEEVFRWEVDEYERHARGPIWYSVAFLVGLSLVLYAIVTRNFLFAIIVIMAGVIIALSTLREPQRIPFLVTTRGVALGSQFIAYKDLKSFWILYEPPHTKKLYVDFRSPITPHLAVPLEDQDPLELREALLQFIMEDPTQEDESLTELLGRVMKL